MRVRTLAILALFLCSPFLLRAQQLRQDSLIEVSGVTMTADSLRAIPDVVVLVKGQDRGTFTNDRGIFSIVLYKGDTLVFRAVGFKRKFVPIPRSLSGSHFSMLQLMVQDTTYLPVTIIHAYPTTREEFAYAFLHWQIPDDKYEIARKNTEAAKLRALSYFVGPDGAEGVSHSFTQQAQTMSYLGMRPPENIFNPLAWAQFIQAWKRGDFKQR